MTLIDVSVPLDIGLPNCPGNTPFSLDAVTRIARGHSSSVSTLLMNAHGGPLVDAPRHCFDHGAGIGTRPLDRLIGPAGDVALVGSDAAPSCVVLRRN